MKSSLVVTLAVLAGAGSAFAQTTSVDRAFTATGTSCEDVTWSDETLEQYPNIAQACREVMERDGRYYVRFEGEVQRVRNRGREVTVDFEGGDRLTLTPPEDMSLYIDGRQRSPRDLAPGDRLNFYVPQDQLVATFFAGEPQSAPAEEAPIRAPEPEERYAATEFDQDRLPQTASALPFAALAGMLLVVLGAALTAWRRLS